MMSLLKTLKQLESWETNGKYNIEVGFGTPGVMGSVAAAYEQNIMEAAGILK